MEFYAINDCIYGSDEDQTTEVFVCKTDNDTYWYCCEGGSNWNESTIEPTDGCNLQSDLHDIDSFTLECRGWTHFVSVMEDHLKVETVDRVNLTIEVCSINEAFQNGDAQEELIRILKSCIDKIERNCFDSCELKDINGNNVGDFYLNIETEEV